MPGKLIPGEKKTPIYKKVGFGMRYQGNNSAFPFKSSPLKDGDHNSETMTDAHKRRHGQKVPKTMTRKDFEEGKVEGFMHPPYRKPKDLAGNVKYHHGYKWKN
jgi:hypothetical protein